MPNPMLYEDVTASVLKTSFHKLNTYRALFPHELYIHVSLIDTLLLSNWLSVAKPCLLLVDYWSDHSCSFVILILWLPGESNTAVWFP